MPTTSPDYWTMLQNGVVNMAAGGAFGSDVARITGRVINPPSPLASPNPTPTPAPVAGQQGVNPAASTGGVAGHFKTHWRKYAIGAAVLASLAVVLKIAKR